VSLTAKLMKKEEKKIENRSCLRQPLLLIQIYISYYPKTNQKLSMHE
jgi:hypothetical protein